MAKFIVIHEDGDGEAEYFGPFEDEATAEVFRQARIDDGIKELDEDDSEEWQDDNDLTIEPLKEPT